MAVKKQKRKPQKNKKKNKQAKARSNESATAWTTNLSWLPTTSPDEDDTSSSSSSADDKDSSTGIQGDEESIDDSNTISIVSWNVLAEAYCTPRSHQRLPKKYQDHVFDRPKRRHHIRQMLRQLKEQLNPDVFALQEVDPPLSILDCMKSMGHDGIETPTSSAGKDSRIDSCGLYFRRDKWTSLESECIRFDDLATLYKDGQGDAKRSDATGRSLQGLQSAFLRRNVGVILRLQSKTTGKRVIVANAHFYWNPAHEFVKLCQAHYMMRRIAEFSLDDDTPIIFCGDLNSQPSSFVHQYLVGGCVNARLIAPWHKMPAFPQPKKNWDQDMSLTELTSSLSHRMERLQLANSEKPAGEVKYLLDYTLNRLCRWLRIFGIDAALETEEEEIERTKYGKVTLFRRCDKEDWTLITTSSRLLNRKDSPAGAYLLNTKSLSNLELALVHLLLSHGVKLEPSKFLSRCVVCNGFIETVTDDSQIAKIFEAHQAPSDIGEEIFDVFQCQGCGQGYWWCDRPTSSASRVKSQATRLLEICIKGGVEISGEMGMFSHVDMEAVRASTSKVHEDVDLSMLGPQLEVVDWMHSESLKNPMGKMKSAYASASDPMQEITVFTNVTSDFLGLLDYVLYTGKTIHLTDRLYVPVTFEELNTEGVHRGHLLPSSVWPSDHLAIGARFSLEGPLLAGIDDSRRVADDSGTTTSSNKQEISRPSTNDETVSMDSLICLPLDQGAGESSQAIPPPIIPKNQHGLRCACGCVPNIPSLFEMAEMRKQARLNGKK